MKKAIWILWPSFIVAGAANGLLFTFVDPADLDLNRFEAYSIGFFSLWAMGAACSAFTCFLQRTADEVNRCPLPPVERPLGCPKREDPNAAC
jgi:hypothetical protein